jgi:predicted helicase
LGYRDTYQFTLHCQSEFRNIGNYRPFDKRVLFYETNLIDRARENLMEHFINKDNVGLLVGRAGQNVKSKVWDLAYITDKITDLNCFYRGGVTIFPLYLYGKYEKGIQKEFKNDKNTLKFNKAVNFRESFLSYISDRYNLKTIEPEQIISYIYAILYSQSYRSKYAERLKTEFPRIPFVKNYALFQKLAKLGRELIEIHLEKTNFNRNITKFVVSGSDIIEKIYYEDDKVYINDTQYFGNIPKEIWDFYIGGYQVLDKWLKSRKGRKLSHQEIEIFVKIVNIIHKTLSVIEEMDRETKSNLF